MKKIILSLILAVLLIPMAAQAFQYSIKTSNRPYPHVTFFSTNHYFVKSVGLKTNLLPAFKKYIITGGNRALRYKTYQLLAWINYRAFMTSTALNYVNTEIKKINYYIDTHQTQNLQGYKEALKSAFYLKSLILARENVSKNKFKALKIVNNYCLNHNDFEYHCDHHIKNNYATYACGSFIVAGNPISGDSFMVTQSLFSTQLQNQLVFMLKQNGYSNISTMNLTPSFISYITPPGKKVFPTIKGLTDMVSSGNLKDFNELVNLFVKHFIRINK